MVGAGPHELDELLHSLRGGARHEEQEKEEHGEEGQRLGDEVDASQGDTLELTSVPPHGATRYAFLLL